MPEEIEKKMLLSHAVVEHSSVQLPEDVRRKLGVVDGDTLVFVEYHGVVLVTKSVPETKGIQTIDTKADYSIDGGK